MSIPTVFISSTREDLQPYRDAARDAAGREGFRFIRMEDFAAAGQPSLEECLKRVADADVLIVIVAYCYGSEPEGHDKSYTWLECDEAARLHKEVLPFFVDKSFRWVWRKEVDHLTEVIDDATEELLAQVKRNRAKLEDFKNELLIQRTKENFTTPEDLWGRVGSALREWRNRRRRTKALTDWEPETSIVASNSSSDPGPPLTA